jgi:drug/metabolite transporter (DMT)-like permease
MVLYREAWHMSLSTQDRLQTGMLQQGNRPGGSVTQPQSEKAFRQVGHAVCSELKEEPLDTAKAPPEKEAGSGGTRRDAEFYKPTAARKPRGKLWLMYAGMLFANTCWAIGIVGTKIALRSMPAAAFAEVRALGAALLFLTLLSFSQGRRFPRHLKLNDWMALAGMAASGIAFSHILYCAGMARTSVVHTGLIAALGPAMVLVISCLLRIERLTALKALGILVSFGGAALLTISRASSGRSAAFIGDLMLLASVAFTSIYAILLKRSAHRFDLLTMNAGVFGLGALFLLPVGAQASLSVTWTAVPGPAWAGLLFVTVMGSVVSYLINAWVMTDLNPSQVQAFMYFQPVMATAMGVLWMGETLPTGALLGGIMIIVGVFLAAR